MDRRTFLVAVGTCRLNSGDGWILLDRHGRLRRGKAFDKKMWCVTWRSAFDPARGRDTWALAHGTMPAARGISARPLYRSRAAFPAATQCPSPAARLAVLSHEADEPRCRPSAPSHSEDHASRRLTRCDVGMRPCSLSEGISRAYRRNHAIL